MLVSVKLGLVRRIQIAVGGEDRSGEPPLQRAAATVLLQATAATGTTVTLVATSETFVADENVARRIDADAARIAELERSDKARDAAVDAAPVTKGRGLRRRTEDLGVNQHVLIVAVVADQNAVVDAVDAKRSCDDVGRKGNRLRLDRARLRKADQLLLDRVHHPDKAQTIVVECSDVGHGKAAHRCLRHGGRVVNLDAARHRIGNIQLAVENRNATRMSAVGAGVDDQHAAVVALAAGERSGRAIVVVTTNRTPFGIRSRGIQDAVRIGRSVAVLPHRMIHVAIVGKDRPAPMATPATGAVLDNAYFGTGRTVNRRVGAAFVPACGGDYFAGWRDIKAVDIMLDMIPRHAVGVAQPRVGINTR